MEIVKVYLAGGMTDLSEEEQVSWRENIKFCFRNCDSNKQPKFFSPPFFYSMFEPLHKTEREVMEFDLYNLRRSDLVVVNFNSPKSIGTSMELAIAYELKIPILALNEKKSVLHPWLAEVCNREFHDEKELINYIRDYYLV